MAAPPRMHVPLLGIGLSLGTEHAGKQWNAADCDRAFREAGLTARAATPTACPGYRHIYNQYVIRVPDRDRLRAYLSKSAFYDEA